MQKVKYILLIGFIAAVGLSFGTRPKERINWLSFEQMQEAYAKNPRPILIDLYTSWCGWCREMDRTTYSNDKVIAYINEHYYAVRYNAESTDSVVFNNKKFGYNKRYKTNEVAMYLSFEQFEYPNTIFLAGINARPAPLSGYMKPKELEAPLKYFAERKNEQQTFVEFNRKLKKEW
jgi:thioredoxin-related protein